jgi:AbrB family looped-hinge helix DNA binding protein
MTRSVYMSALPKVQSQGQVTLPATVRAEAGIEPGDVVAFKVVGPGKVELTALRPMSLDALIAKYGRGEPIADWNAFRAEAEAAEADETLRRMRDEGE